MTATYIIQGGAVIGLAGGPISLADLPRETTRLSKVEFNSAGNVWEVIARNGELLHTNIDYDAALRWEVNYFNDLLAESASLDAFEASAHLSE